MAANGVVYLIFFRALVYLSLHVFPAIVRDIEGLAGKLPTYVNDFDDPAVAIVAVIVGANLAGVLGALIAIPTAASLWRDP